MTEIKSEQKSGRLLVVTYHYVREKGGPYPGIHPVTSQELAQQIIRLKENFRVVDMNEVIEFAKGQRPLAEDSFFITFDDGLQDHYISARKVLNSLGIKAAFFVPTRPHKNSLAPVVHKVHWLRANMEPSQFVSLLRKALPEKWSNLELSEIDKKRAAQMHIHDIPEIQALKFALNFIIPYNVVDIVTSQMITELGMSEAKFCQMTFMDYGQLRELADEGHIIGLHGHNHVPLSSLNDKELNEDITMNAATLTQALGASPRWLSYPYGRPDAIPVKPEKLCQNHAIDVAFTLSSGLNEFGVNSALLKRITPNELNDYIS